MRRCRAAIAMAFVASCQSLVDPPLPQDAQAMVAPAVYATWWAMTEACSGRTAPLTAVHWYQVPGAGSVPDPEYGNVSGYWSGASNRIVLAGDLMWNGPLVRHEMLHSLLQRGGHPREDFVVRCAGIVDCLDACFADAGPSPRVDPAIATIPTTSLIAALDVSPATPSASGNDGFFAVTLSVTNPLDTPVRVTLPDSSRANFGIGFSYLIRGPSGGQSLDVRPKDVSGVVFAPHERKVQVFDFRIGVDGAGEWPPGVYSVTGQFGAWSGPSVTTSITLSP